MKMPTVDKFLWYDLKTTGKALGWFGVICASIATILVTASMIYTYSFSCDDLMKYQSFRNLLKELSVKDCLTLKFDMVSAILGCLISIFIYGSMLRGIQTNNHRKILPAVYLIGFETIGIVSSELGSYSAREIISALSTGAFMIYIVIVVYSLYVKVRDEYQAREFINNFDA